MGEMVNIIAVNIQSLYEFAHHVNQIWSCSFSLTIGVALLWHELGFASLAGLIVMALFTPFGSFVTTRAKRLQISKLKCQDSRIKTTNEVLSGIRLIKFYAWEVPFMKMITGLRRVEIGYLKKIANLEALSNFSWTFSPFLVNFQCFFVNIQINLNFILKKKGLSCIVWYFRIR